MNNSSCQHQLFVGVCVTKRDWTKYKDSLLTSIQNIAHAWSGKILAFVVLQGGKVEFADCSDFPDYFCFHDTEKMGVSIARNKCIEKATSIGAEFILFHDASIFWPFSSAQFIYLNRDTFPKVKVNFSDTSSVTSPVLEKGTFKDVNPIYDTYVWSYLFRVGNISDIRFSENFGPGECTRYKSGEDVIFLFDYFNKIKSREVFEAQFACVYHPPRSKKFDKHLIYAEGQGKVYQILLGRYPNFVLYRDLLLFFGNAIFRCLLLRSNSFNILKNRINGFFNRGI